MNLKIFDICLHAKFSEFSSDIFEELEKNVEHKKQFIESADPS